MGLQVSLQNVSKKYSNHFIIKDFSFEFKSDKSYVILGSNGSGKSTLIKLLTGLYTPSKGEVQFILNDTEVPADQLFSHISLAAPWSDVLEDFTLSELVNFHFKFRRPIAGMSQSEIISISGLSQVESKLIHQFSSGMKQRVRLLLAFTTDSDLLLLDEPTSNLDAAGKSWYRDLVDKFSKNRTLIVASNHVEDEYNFCEYIIDLNA